MATVLVSKGSTMTKAEFGSLLNDLADELAQIGLADEADRAREIAREVLGMPDNERSPTRTPISTMARRFLL